MCVILGKRLRFAYRGHQETITPSPAAPRRRPETRRGYANLEARHGLPQPSDEAAGMLDKARMWDAIAGHVILVARRRGWPVLTADPDRLRRIAPDVDVDLLQPDSTEVLSRPEPQEVAERRIRGAGFGRRPVRALRAWQDRHWYTATPCAGPA